MTWHIHITGQVQGVGFRPFVFLLAKECGLTGWVNNATDGVHVEFNAGDRLAQRFYQKLLDRAPRLARITQSSLTEVTPRSFADFQIVHSELAGTPNLLLTPDFALCSECRQELHEPSNPRFEYPFITCTNCGPRYSIVQKLPYDRPHTTMDAFQMCAHCQGEYDNPQDRRYYSQTNSCPDCAIELALFAADQVPLPLDQNVMVHRVVAEWKAGGIVAVKGIGGYLLTCDASQSEAVRTLRKRKHRPSKPFALMFPDEDRLAQMLTLGPEARAALLSPAAPIVLLRPSAENAFTDIAPRLDKIGAMLPYTPLFERLLQIFGKPIVATSGNISEAPIVFQDDKARQELSAVADLVLSNNRPIVVPQDDSVVTFTDFYQKKIILRRSRGWAPTYLHAELELPAETILAMGAMLKNTVALLHRGNIYLSQYLGNLEHFDTEKNFRHTIEHLLGVCNAHPEQILGDRHPDYPSTRHGQELAQSGQIPFHAYQHHLAHFGAVLGEHNLIHTAEPILGVIWDGTGLGEDGQIWGGEFFKYESYDFLRCCHFDYFPAVLGDKMPREPRISALAACWEVPGSTEILQEKFTKIEWQVYSKLLENDPPLQTSSVGRLFDAAASLLGLMDKQSYEGEAALLLENLALKYLRTNGLDFFNGYVTEGVFAARIPTQTLLTNLIEDLCNGRPKDLIAAKFHCSLVQIIQKVANHLQLKKIACSGGVFQNGLLVDLMHHHLATNFELYFHHALAPNDENISFGQVVCYQIEQHKKALLQPEKNTNVLRGSR